MRQPAINEQLVRRYLLDDLPKRERERLEVGLLTDDRYYETLTTLEGEVEDELIEEYLDGELTGTERENFERVFLNSPERAYKLKAIRDLKEHAATEAEPEAPQRVLKTDPPYRRWIAAVGIFQNPLFGLSTAAALILALVFCASLWMRASRLETQLMEASTQHPTDSVLKEQVEQLSRRNEELAARLQRSEEQRVAAEQQVAALKRGAGQEVVPPDNDSQPAHGTVASVILTSSMRSNGSGNVPTLTLRTGVTIARLVVNVERIDPADYKRFRAVVQKQGGPEVWRSEDVKLRSRGNNARVVLNISAEKLTEGQYVGALDGITLDEQTEPIGRYIFRVQNR
jgi:hypothetical protein